MQPYYERGGITIYHGYCRAVLPELSLRADAVVADPPYGIVNRFGWQHRLDGTRRLQFAWDDENITDEVIEGLSAALDLAHDRAGAFVFCGGDQLGRVFDCLRRHNFTAKPACWVKACPPPTCPGNWWPSGFEYAAYGYRTGAYFGETDPKRSNVFVADSYRHGQPGKVDHPT